MNVVSLFAGIGGFELGLERAGMTIVAQCEISEKCRHLLRTHWPDVQQFGDIRAMTAADVPHRVDVLCGGFPCQDLSFAGKGAGLAGERSGLWREYARLVREFRPDYVIVENVAALLGRGLGDVLGDLASLGYDAWWDCIPASSVGAPHRRDRLWIVAYPGGVEHEGYGDALRREVAKELSCTDPDADRQPFERIGRGVSKAQGPLTRWSRDGHRGVGWWTSEPPMDRVAYGVPARVDRLHGLGNAVVPAIPEILGRAIIAARMSAPANQNLPLPDRIAS